MNQNEIDKITQLFNEIDLSKTLFDEILTSFFSSINKRWRWYFDEG